MAADERKLNILFITCDQLRRDAVGAMGLHTLDAQVSLLDTAGVGRVAEDRCAAVVRYSVALLVPAVALLVPAEPCVSSVLDCRCGTPRHPPWISWQQKGLSSHSTSLTAFHAGRPVRARTINTCSPASLLALI